MDDIFIYTDNSYTEMAIKHFLCELNYLHDDRSRLAIFSIEGNVVSEECLLAMIECNAFKILVLAKKSVLNFLSAILQKKNISFKRNDTSLRRIKFVLMSFLYFYDPEEKQAWYPKNTLKTLSLSERKITLLYTQGLSLNNISELLNRSVKTISSHKRQAMNKLGITSNIELMQKIRLMQSLD